MIRKWSPPVDESSEALGDGDDFDPLIEGGSHHGPECRVHPGRVASGRENGQAAVEGIATGIGEFLRTKPSFYRNRMTTRIEFR